MKWLKELTFRHTPDGDDLHKMLVIQDDSLDRDHQLTLLATDKATPTPDGGLSIPWEEICIPRVVEQSELPLYMPWKFKTTSFEELMRGELCLN